MLGKTSDDFHEYMQQYDMHDKGEGLYVFKSQMIRKDFPSILAGWGCETGVEVGVAFGTNAEYLVNHLHGTIYLVDSYKHFPAEIYPEGVRTNPEQDTLSQRYIEIVEKFKKFPNAKVIRKESVEALSDIENESLDFVYIDCNHTLPFVWQDVRGWWPKLKIGGIMSGHDINGSGVFKAVTTFLKEKNITRWYQTGDHNWLFIKGEENGGVP